MEKETSGRIEAVPFKEKPPSPEASPSSGQLSRQARPASCISPHGFMVHGDAPGSPVPHRFILKLFSDFSLPHILKR